MAPFQFSIWFAIRYVLCMRNFSTFFFSSKFWKISLSMVFRFFRRLCCFCCYNLQLILLNFRLNNSSFQFGKTSATNYQFRAHCTWWTCLTIMLAENFCFFFVFHVELLLLSQSFGSNQLECNCICGLQKWEKKENSFGFTILSLVFHDYLLRILRWKCRFNSAVRI